MLIYRCRVTSKAQLSLLQHVKLNPLEIETWERCQLRGGVFPHVVKQRTALLVKNWGHFKGFPRRVLHCVC